MPTLPRAPQMAMPLPAAEEPPAIEWSQQGGPIVWQNGVYTVVWNAEEQSAPVTITGLAPPTTIGGPWQVTFPPKLGAPAQATFEKLASWSDNADGGIKYFSGTAAYRNHFIVSAEALGAGKRLYLDLGRVQVLAEVIVNGRNLGVLWKLPFRVDVTDAAHAGSNDLEIRVTNLWPNRLIGDEQQPAEYQYTPAVGRGGAAAGSGTPGSITRIPDWYAQNQPKPAGSRITFTTWHHWNAGEPLLESGLIGPVQLRSAVRLSLGG
jgi:hypothetical protein